ncbi:hypothetical protein QOZ80_8BG0647270 [Eleusine coracana subsp. coracana]|nr:hypothetical protein QOZ80_8BG0647270 [Eleusine coracana subsp. coracana]
MAASSHVLLVDDACLDPSIIRNILDNGNNHATHAANPIQALKLLDMVNDVKLILTDYHMTNMPGFDLLKDVKESPRLEHIPVVIFSMITLLMSLQCA